MSGSASRRIVAAVVLLLATGATQATAAVNRVTLRAVERAFYETRIPFSEDWQPTRANPYLVPKRPAGGPIGTLPTAVRGHLVGSASYVNATTFKTRTVYVFDSTSAASGYRSWIAHHCKCGNSMILLAHNVVYLGSPSSAARRAMARLAR